MGHTRVQVWTFLTTYVLLYHPLFFLRINPYFDSFKHWKHALAPMSLVVDITRDVLTKSDASLSKKEFTQAPWALRENLTMLHAFSHPNLTCVDLLQIHSTFGTYRGQTLKFDVLYYLNSQEHLFNSARSTLWMEVGKLFRIICTYSGTPKKD